MSTSDTKQPPGDQFEGLVAELLNFMPGAKAERHLKVVGKDVDVVCELEGGLGATIKIAVECKDYSRPLARKIVVSTINDYEPLLVSGKIDRFYLITRSGIVANAAELFDHKKRFHFTYSDLQDLVWGPKNLIDNMTLQFSLDQLDQYYIPTRCGDIDLDFIAKNYDKIYNQFMDFAISTFTEDFVEVKNMWVSHDYQERLDFVNENYTKSLFDKSIYQRNTFNTSNLEDIFFQWMDDPKNKYGLAVLGTYGTGKSSFARYAARECAKRYKQGKSNRIPILIELKEFGSHQDMEGLITHQLVNKHGIHNGSYALFRSMNKKGRFILIFDGFDEMKQGMTRDALIFNFSEINKHIEENSKVMICGRPTVFDSEEDQTNILTAASNTNIDSQARYIQVQVAALTQAETFLLLRNFIEAKSFDKRDELLDKIDQLEGLIEDNEEIRDLLSRPVHLPMLVTILPDIGPDLGGLNRVLLYRKFIERIIMREVQKVQATLQYLYSSEQRYKFASELAAEMFQMGNSQSIRLSEIPAKLVDQYVTPGATYDSTRRDLVSACFLDRKPPDLLVFAHKSFSEFLFAERIFSKLREANPNTNELVLSVNSEVCVFLADMVDKREISKMYSYLSQNYRVLALLVGTLIGSPLISVQSKKNRKDDIQKISIKWDSSESSKAKLSDFFSPERLSIVYKSNNKDLARFRMTYFNLFLMYFIQKEDDWNSLWPDAVSAVQEVEKEVGESFLTLLYYSSNTTSSFRKTITQQFKNLFPVSSDIRDMRRFDRVFDHWSDIFYRGRVDF